MQVMFKLNDSQKYIAKSILDGVKSRNVNVPTDTADEKWFYAGNLIGWKLITEDTSVNQKLFLTPSGDFMRYEGDRRPLHKNGAIEIIKQIAGGDTKSLRYSHYETEDESLAWWQTTEEFILRVHEVKLLNWLKQKKFLTIDEKAALRQRIATGVNQHLQSVIELGSSAHRKLSAAGLGWKINAVNYAHKLAAA